MTLTNAQPSANGTVAIEGNQASLYFKRRLAHPVELVWAALTEPAQRDAWFGATTLEPRAGGSIDMDPDDPPVAAQLKHMRGRILVWDPPRVLEHTWQQTVVGEGVVRYELASDDSGTILTFSHRGLSVPNAQGFVPGTHAYLDRLEAFLAGAPVPNWQARYDELAPQYGVGRSGR
jgi:uncharacterized protein YndB with AHSA1/START domain